MKGNKFNLRQGKDLLIVEIKNLHANIDRVTLLRQEVERLLAISKDRWEGYCDRNPSSAFARKYLRDPSKAKAFSCQEIVESDVKELTHVQISKKSSDYNLLLKTLDTQVKDKQKSIDIISGEVKLCELLMIGQIKTSYQIADLQVPSPTSEELDVMDFIPIEDYASHVGGFEFVNLNSDLILKLEWTVYTDDGYKVVRMDEYHHIWSSAKTTDERGTIPAHGTWYLDTTGQGNIDDLEEVDYEKKFLGKYKHEAQFLTSTAQFYVNQLSSYRE